ncbi:MAG: YitT family protein [Atopococcus tabaci]|uniref:YitT family protein n=1 Tax=Atopococcus tabaci TaxID=269774 RepID=A0AA43UD69_9LACT|nr:YitT family protein [Atopococcus tabaci]
MNIKVKRFLKESVVIAFGSFIIAFAYHSFILPHHIVGGGASGVATLFLEVFGFNPAVTLYAINIPLLLLCWFVLGKDIFRKTVIGSFMYPFMVDLTKGFPSLTNDLLLASIFGGVIMGVGIALIFKVDASTGGTSILVQIMKEKLDISLGTATIIIDGMIVLSSLFVFDAETVLYAVINIVTLSKAIDLVEVGPPADLNIFVVSDYPQQVIDRVRAELVRSVTILEGKGGYKGEDREVLFIVVNNSQYKAFIEIMEDIDPAAFIVVNNAKEVKGRGFSLERNFMENINRIG